MRRPIGKLSVKRLPSTPQETTGSFSNTSVGTSPTTLTLTGTDTDYASFASNTCTVKRRGRYRITAIGVGIGGTAADYNLLLATYIDGVAVHTGPSSVWRSNGAGTQPSVAATQYEGDLNVGAAITIRGTASTAGMPCGGSAGSTFILTFIPTSNSPS